jgi:hypothetical protein
VDYEALAGIASLIQHEGGGPKGAGAKGRDHSTIHRHC